MAPHNIVGFEVHCIHVRGVFGMARRHTVRVRDVDGLVHRFRPSFHLHSPEHLQMTVVLGFQVRVDLRDSHVRRL